MIAKPTINSPLPCKHCKLLVYWEEDANHENGDYRATEESPNGYRYQCDVKYDHEPVSFNYYIELCK